MDSSVVLVHTGIPAFTAVKRLNNPSLLKGYCYYLSQNITLTY